MFRSKRGVIIFVKNPVRGKVKTRLAKEIGEDKALEIYKKLLQKTIETAAGVNQADRQVWYSEYADQHDFIDPLLFRKRVQRGADLGERMENAFATLFAEGYSRVVIIGSDCPGLTTEQIGHAFTLLESEPLVVGPARDGGYYLLGMNRLHKRLFDQVPWSTNQVLEETLKRAEAAGIRVGMLAPLYDIDTLDDLKKSTLFEEK